MCLVFRFNKIKFSCFVMVDSIKLIEVCSRALRLLKGGGGHKWNRMPVVLLKAGADSRCGCSFTLEFIVATVNESMQI